MSVHKQPNGKWRVMYRVNGRQRSRTFDRKGDATTFDAEIRRRKQLGPALAAELDRSTLTLDGYVRGPWRAHAATLAAPTRAKYAWALQKHLTELLDEPLLVLDVARLAQHQRLLLDRGATPSTVREVLARLSGILQTAVEHGHLNANAARALRKVPADVGDEVRPLAPSELERLVAGLEGRDRAIVLLAGHLGLRPLEVRAAPWSAFDGSVFMVGRARTKRTARRTRTISVPDMTARELKAWRLRSGRPGDDQPIIGVMTANAMKLWGRRVLRPAAKAATGGRDDVTLYTLRHTHASACHYAGFTIPEAARRLGHGPGLHVETYAHVIDGLNGRRYADLDALIAAARAELVLPHGYMSADTGQ
jgi:integrase/recombinase XerC